MISFEHYHQVHSQIKFMVIQDKKLCQFRLTHKHYGDVKSVLKGGAVRVIRAFKGGSFQK